MQNPVKEIPKFYAGLRSRYIDLREAIKLYKYLSGDLSSGELKTLNNFQSFFSIVEISLNHYIAVSLTNFVYHIENSKGKIETKRSLKQYINLVIRNIKPLAKEFAPDSDIKDLTSEFENQVSKIESKEENIKRLRENRDNLYAHHSEKSFNDLKKFHEDHPLFWQDIIEIETLCKEILDWHGNTFGFSTIGDLYNHKTVEEAKSIFYRLTFYQKAGDSVLSGEMNSELSGHLLHKTDEEVNRREVEIINANAEKLNEQVLETLDLQAEIIKDFLKNENSSKRDEQLGR